MYAIQLYKKFNFYKTLNFGYFLLFVSYFIDSIDQIFIHSILYTVVMEKSTLLLAAIFIYIGSKQWMENFKAISLTDDLTDIPNRKLCRESITREIIIGQKYETSLCLAVIDIDHFKSINDKYGHNVGDKVLQAFAQKLTHLIRDQDSVGRWGGEEFIVLLKGIDLEGAIKAMSRLKVNVSGHKFIFDEIEVNITTSIGISQMTQEDDFESLFVKADKVLFEAKNSGRNKVRPSLKE